MKVHMDLIGKNGVRGEVANHIAAHNKLDAGLMRPWIAADGRVYVTTYRGGDPKQLASYSNVPMNVPLIQTTGTLRRDEWKQLDDAVLQISRSRLVGVDDLRAKNLVFNLGNAMGTTVLEYHDISDAMDAVMSMDGMTRGQNDRPEYGYNYLPIPIIHVDFEIKTRELEASRNRGIPLDTTDVEVATRKCLEKLDALLFTNTTYAYGYGNIYSYVNAPYRNAVTMVRHWDAAATTGEQIVQDVSDMKQASINDKHYGPWMLYIPTAYETKIDGDYNSYKTQTIRERIMKIEGIQGIKVIDSLPADTVLLVQMTPDVVRLVFGMGIQVVQWQAEGNFVNKYKVMTIQVPQIRNDQAQRSGIVQLAPAQ